MGHHSRLKRLKAAYFVVILVKNAYLFYNIHLFKLKASKKKKKKTLKTLNGNERHSARFNVNQNFRSPVLITKLHSQKK